MMGEAQGVAYREQVNARTGDTLAREQVEAEGKEQVLKSVGQAATSLRQKQGEG